MTDFTATVRVTGAGRLEDCHRWLLHGIALSLLLNPHVPTPKENLALGTAAKLAIAFAMIGVIVVMRLL